MSRPRFRLRSSGGAVNAPRGEGAIRMFHVSKSYLAGSFALRDVSIELAKGEFVFLTGPSGAGKTSLLKLVFGAERPSEGQIVVLGRNIVRLGESAVPPLRRKIGVVFQDFKLLPRRTVEENVALALQVHQLAYFVGRHPLCLLSTWTPRCLASSTVRWDG